MADGVADQVTRWFAEGANVPAESPNQEGAHGDEGGRSRRRGAGALGPRAGDRSADFTPAREPPKPLLHAPPPEELRAALEEAVVRDLLGPAGGPDGGDHRPLRAGPLPRGHARAAAPAHPVVGQRPPRAPGAGRRRGGRGGRRGARRAHDVPVGPGPELHGRLRRGAAARDRALGALHARRERDPDAPRPAPRMVWKRTPVEAVVELPPLSEGPSPSTRSPSRRRQRARGRRAARRGPCGAARHRREPLPGQLPGRARGAPGRGVALPARAPRRGRERGAGLPGASAARAVRRRRRGALDGDALPRAGGVRGRATRWPPTPSRRPRPAPCHAPRDARGAGLRDRGDRHARARRRPAARRALPRHARARRDAARGPRPQAARAAGRL
jgi:hypothetical protein